jgi:hypothetical protein
LLSQSSFSDLSLFCPLTHIHYQISFLPMKFAVSLNLSSYLGPLCSTIHLYHSSIRFSSAHSCLPFLIF